MKRSIKGILLGLVLAGFGCSTDTDTTDRPLFDNGINVFQVQLYDGTTGAAITTGTISVQIGAHALSGTINNGVYTVYGIPQGTFAVTVTATGYNVFQANVTFNGWGWLSDGDSFEYTTNSIVLYPTGNVPEDIRVHVAWVADGLPVAGAPVVALLSAGSNPIAVNLGNLLPPDFGLGLTVANATTDANGDATFAGTSLMFGATYDLMVLAAQDGAGHYLMPTNSATVKVGTDYPYVVIGMDLPDLNMPNITALYANNEVVWSSTTAILSYLEFTFPYPMQFCNPNAPAAAPTMDYSLAGGGSGLTKSTPAVTASFTDANSTVLRLVANHTGTASGEYTVDFSDVYIQPVGTNWSNWCWDLSNVDLRGSGSVDTSIRISH